MARKKKHSSGMYRMSITLGRGEDGRPVRQYVYGHTKEECENKLATLRVERNLGVAVTDRKSTWNYWADMWKALKYKGIGKSTQGMYDSALNHLSPLKGREIASLTPLDMIAIVSSMEGEGYAKKTINTVIQTASQIIALARRNRAIAVDITEDVSAPRSAPTEQRRALSREEQDALWGVKPIPAKNKIDQYRADRLPLARMLALMTLSCGLRRGETVALRWEHVDLEGGSIHVSQSYDYRAGKTKGPKTKAGNRRVPIPAKYKAELTEWKKSTNSLLVFSLKGDYISEGEHEKLWDVLLDAINGITVSARISAGRSKKKVVEIPTRKIEFTSHDLRHTFATEAAGKGVDIKTLQYIMGHEKVDTLLNIYAHFSQDAWEAAARILDGDNKSSGDSAETVKNAK